MKHRLIPALLAGCLAAASMAQASEAPTRVRVDMRGLDLGTSAGLKTAELRIARAVKMACRSDVEHLSPRARRIAKQCRAATRDLAMRTLRHSQLQRLAAQ